MDSTDSKSPSKQASAINNFTVQKLPILVSVIETKISWPIANQCFFFPCENQKCPWNVFFTIFPVFFTGAKPFSRALFSRFSRLVQTFHGDFLGFFHGFDLRFHGRKTKNFHGSDIFFTGRISETKIKKAKNYNFDTQNTKNLCKKRYFLK